MKYAQNALAADPAGGAHDTPPDPVVGWAEPDPQTQSTPSAPSVPRSSRLRRSLLWEQGRQLAKAGPDHDSVGFCGCNMSLVYHDLNHNTCMTGLC